MILIEPNSLNLIDDNLPKNESGYSSPDKDSYYEKLVYDWWPMDTETLFLSNLKKYPNDESLLYYLNNPIQYKVNQYGFRTDSPFKLDNVGNVFLGCSHTFGIGHHLENTWSYKLNQKIGGDFFNMASPGNSVQMSYRILEYWYDKLEIKNIFHFQPLYHRYLFYNDVNTTHNLDNIINVNTDNLGEFEFGDLTCPLLSDYNLKVEYRVYTNAINSIANSIGANYYVYIPSTHNFLPEENLDDVKARDLAHLTVNEHHSIFDRFYKKII